MATQTCVVVDRGVDYLTLTTPPGGKAEELLQVGYEVATELFGGGMWEVKAWGANGYRGEKLGTLGYGSSEQGAIVQCSGGAANALAERCANVGIDFRCTRIDLQVTGQFNRDRSAYARNTAREIRAQERGAQAHRPATLAGYNTYGRGDTLASGSRSSERYLRLYDKSRERGGTTASNLWRWEVEFKRKLAAIAWEQVLRAKIAAEHTESIVVSEFTRRGVVIPWAGSKSGEVIASQGQRSDVYRKLAWLRNQVLPTIKRLRELGYGDTVDALLMLPCDNSNEVE